MINNFSQKIRSDITQLSFKSKSAHLGSCLSLVEMLIAVINFSKKKKISVKLYSPRAMPPWLTMQF